MKRIFFCLLLALSYSAFAQDATPVLIFPVKYLPVGSHVFDVMVKNVGTANIAYQGFNIGWQVDNGPVSELAPVIPAYSVMPNSETRVAGNFKANFTTTGTHTLKVWTRLTIGTDGNTQNDTLVQQVKVLSYVPKKKVVFEVFKHQGCCPCVDAAAYEDTAIAPFAAYSVANIYGDNSDPLFNPEGDSVDNLFLLAHPTVFFDRFKFPYTPDLINNFFTLNNLYQLRNMEERDRYYEPLEVSFSSASFNTGSRVLKVKLKAKVYDTIADSYRFNLYLTEDSVKEFQACATSPNDYYHMHVLRRMMGGAWGHAGSLPSKLYPGTDYFHEFTYTVPASYNLDQMDLTGIVQRYSTDKLDSRIINSDHIRFNAALALSADGIRPEAFESLKVFPNPVEDQLHFSGTASIKGTVSMIISGIDGKTVKRFITRDINTPLEVSDLAPGNYMISLEQGANKTAFKFVKR